MKKIFYSMFAACALLFGACDDDETTLIEVKGDDPAAATLTVSSDNSLLNVASDGKTGTIRFKSGGGELLLNLATNQTTWDYDNSNESWLKVEADEFENTLLLSVGRNTAATSPEAVLTLTAGTGSNTAVVTLNVSQNVAGDPEIDVAAAEVVIPARGELTAEYEFDTNQDEWTFDVTCSWLFVEQAERSLILTAEPNPDTTARSVEIVLTAGYGADVARDTITVLQEAAAYVIPSPVSLGFDNEGGTKTITVVCNYDWDFEVEGEWLAVTREDDVLTVTVDEYREKDPLAGAIAITGGKDANTETVNVPVSQAGYDENNIVLIYTIPADGSIAAAPIMGTVNCTVDWGDGTVEEITSETPLHTYGSAGEYVVTISGEVSRFSTESTAFSSDKTRYSYITRVKQWGKTGLTSMEKALYNCEYVTSIPSDVAHSFDNVTTFSYAFYYCKALEEIPAGLFKNATEATSYNNVFAWCVNVPAIPEDLFESAGNVTDFSYAFAYCAEISKIPAGLFRNAGKGEDFSFLFNKTGIVSTNTNYTEGLLTEIPAGLFDNCTSAVNFTATFGYTNVKSIPAGLFDNCTEATNMQSVFTSCVSLSSIPAGLFDKNTKVTTFYNIFNNCGITSIPAGLFDNNTAVTTFRMTFAGTDITSIPAGLFDGKTAVTNYNGCFYNCSNLTTVPAGLFKDATAVTDIGRIFMNCKSLTTVPEDIFSGVSTQKAAVMTYLFDGSGLTSIPANLLRSCVMVTNLGYAFENCPNLTSIPEGLFAANTKATTFTAVFKNCTGLTSISENLFANNTAATNFGSAFYGCTGLTSIPEDLFANSANATTFSSVFYGCTGLTSIPAGLFTKQTKVTTGLASAFYGCTGLTSIPETLFATNTAVTSFNSTFYGCTGLTSIPAGLFDNNKKVTNFGKTFMGCNALTGESPYTEIDGVKVHLYDRTTALGFSSVSTKTDCFDGCTGLSDYNDIPTTWK